MTKNYNNNNVADAKPSSSVTPTTVPAGLTASRYATQPAPTPSNRSANTALTRAHETTTNENVASPVAPPTIPTGLGASRYATQSATVGSPTALDAARYAMQSATAGIPTGLDASRYATQSATAGIPTGLDASRYATQSATAGNTTLSPDTALSIPIVSDTQDLNHEPQARVPELPAESSGTASAGSFQQFAPRPEVTNTSTSQNKVIAEKPVPAKDKTSTPNMIPAGLAASRYAPSDSKRPVKE